MLLKLILFIQQFKIAMTGALYPAINQEQLKNILVPLPPLDVQNTIVNKIFGIKGKIKTYRQKSQNLSWIAKQEFEEAVFGGESNK